MTIGTQAIDNLKTSDHLFAAGALQASLGYPREYGCHFGMRSTRDNDRAEFLRGFDSYHGAR